MEKSQLRLSTQDTEEAQVAQRKPVSMRGCLKQTWLPTLGLVKQPLCPVLLGTSASSYSLVLGIFAQLYSAPREFSQAESYRAGLEVVVTPAVLV